MPDNALIELDKTLTPPSEGARLAPLEAWKRSLHLAGQEYAREVQRGVRGILGAAAKFEEGWDICRREVLAGHADEVQQRRDRFLHAFEERLAHLREALELVRFASLVGAGELPEAEKLKEEMAALGARLERLTSRWQTQEDLEDLVAEDFPLTGAQLKAIAEKHPPPQAWYDEDFQPF